VILEAAMNYGVAAVSVVAMFILQRDALAKVADALNRVEEALTKLTIIVENCPKK